MQTNTPRTHARSATAAIGFALAALAFLAACPARGQEPEDGMVVRRVEIVGLQALQEGYVRRIIKTRESQPYSRAQVEEDVRELLRSRKFLNAFAVPTVEDGQAVVVFTVQEKPTIRTVELEGNKRFSDTQLFELTPASGDVIDLYAIRRARDELERKYREAGYYYATVELDEPALAEEARVVYRITEGPRVRVRRVAFEGNFAFPDWRLRGKIHTRTYIWIFRTGAFDPEVAERDAVDLQKFYRDEGFLDARVGYRLEFDQVSRSDLAVVFVLEEGQRYRIQDIVVEGNTVLATERLRELMQLAPGRLARDEPLQQDRRRVQDAYGEIGYIDAQVETRYDFLEEPGLVVLRYGLTENRQFRFGRITIRGNTQTRDEVVRRELLFYPGELYNAVEARAAEQRLRETGLFTEATITPLPPEDALREALVEVKEADAITFLIGVGVSTDNGVLGSLSIENRNFDITDWPETPGEFFRGRAFRGDGQRLKFTAEPGTELSRFRIDFTEPYLFDRRLRFDASAYLFQRGRDGYSEERIGGVLSLSRRFRRGPLANWAIEGALRLENVDIDDLEFLVAREIWDVRGSSYLSTFKGTLVRDTTDSRLVPTRGYRFSMAWEQAGALGGDYDFGKPSLGFAWYKTLRTDIFDRKSVLGLHADTAYIVGDAPVFERFYGGGFGSLRGFEYRGISPRSGLRKNRVGGDFVFLTGAEYSFPLYGKTFRGVTFLDMGTVEDDFGISSWRAAIGVGLRIHVDFFGPVPIVLDFGIPIAKQDEDDTQVFNFAFGASF